MIERSTLEGYGIDDTEASKKNPYAHVLTKILQEKRDTEQFLRMIAPQYLGVYVVDKETDFVRDILGPDYFRKIVKEENGSYSEGLKIYRDRFVVKEDRAVIQEVLDYDYIYEVLWSGRKIDRSYQKTDGNRVSLKIARYSSNDEEKNLSLWIFKDEGIEYKLQKQRKMMEALSIDYTAVFECDLLRDSIRPLTMKETSHSFYHKDHMVSFSQWIAYSYDHVVVKDSAPQFLEEFTPAHLIEYFKDHDSLITRHRTLPDRRGVEYFEMRVIPVSKEKTSYKVLLAYRPIDDIVKSEKKQQEELSRALNAAEQSNRAKTTFLNNMSHDIRTPMNAIVGFTALAREHMDQRERVEEYLSKITTSSAHLLSLINDILDMSRIESGSVKLDERPVHMPDLLDDLQSMMQGLADDKKQELYIDTVDIEHEDVIVDRLRLNQVLLNIISNAIKFTPKGGAISIRLLERPCLRKGYTTYEFSVKDTGIGMSQEFLTHVFDTFAREHSSTVSGIQGTGLGMAITKNIVELMGGKITAESQEGRGSEFIVSLDVKLTDLEKAEESDPESKKRPNAEVESGQKQIYDYRGKRVLLVDDNELNREIATALLEDVGMEVDCAGDGIEAIDIIAQSPWDRYDLIFMDIQMPKMDGYTATREIRTLSDGRKSMIPIVAMTANAFEEDKRKSYQSGMNGHISKPISIELIAKVLDEIF